MTYTQKRKPHCLGFPLTYKMGSCNYNFQIKFANIIVF